MGILLSEGSTCFHVPYGPAIIDGSLETRFLDLKTDPQMIPILPPCVGWPETQELLTQINTAQSPFMTLAADQSYANGPDSNRPVILVSFVSLCFAEISHNTKDFLSDLVLYLQHQMNVLLQDVSTILDHTLDLEIILEIQPTQFHHQHIQGWSLTVMMVASGQEHNTVRGTWGYGIHALIDGLNAYAPHEA
ncbi:MAG: hypothetical protein OET79_01695 [Nitrospirota bacterium]|nr:hypothetical protein [Nitrospirota bacterium]